MRKNLNKIRLETSAIKSLVASYLTHGCIHVVDTRSSTRVGNSCHLASTFGIHCCILHDLHIATFLIQSHKHYRKFLSIPCQYLYIYIYIYIYIYMRTNLYLRLRSGWQSIKGKSLSVLIVTAQMVNRRRDNGGPG
jgi:hypothetical protein